MAANQSLLFLTLSFCCVCAKQEYVVIIGAGAAGLAATTRLLAHNITNVFVLEAEDRIGGRVNSVLFSDVVVELGAEMVDGAEGNIVYDLVKDLNILGEPEAGWDMILFSDGKALSKKLSQEVSGIFGEVSKSLIGIGGVNVTTGDAFPQAYKSVIQKKFSNDPATLNLALQCLPLLEKIALATDSSFSWYDSSASRTFRNIPGPQAQRWNDKGFKQIFDVMAQEIPNTSSIESVLEYKIHLNKNVSEINYEGENPIVTYGYGSAFQAAYVLFTPSLGVLKQGHEGLFQPALPEKKVKAIEDLGYGAIMKIIVHYKDNWWPNDTGAGGYNLVFTPNDEAEIAKLFPNDPIKYGKPWLSSILGIYPWKQTSILVFWVVGPLVPNIENLSDDRINAGLHYLLTKFFQGHQVTITKPDKIMKTSWYSNPHFCGTHSFETVRSGGGAHADLAEPIRNKLGRKVLFFAGEATVSGHYGTVHGAVESGYRGADMILKEMGTTKKWNFMT